MFRFRIHNWHNVYWLQKAPRAVAQPQQLTGKHSADVVVIGGGLVGLWTAITIKEQAPDTSVMIVEAAFCGYGASGRNGGFVYPWTTKADLLLQLYGPQQAEFLLRESIAGVRRIQDFCENATIPTHFVPGRTLWAATAPAHMGSWDAAVAACREVGLAGEMTVLDAAQAAQQAGTDRHLAGALIAHSGTVNPARLVAALAAHAQQLGVQIFAGSPVRHFSSTASGATVVAKKGQVACRNVVVATNAWAGSLPGLRRQLFVISSDIVATEPAPALLEDSGWSAATSIFDSNLMLDYYRLTKSGRIIFGKGGWTIGWSGHIPARMMRASTLADLAYDDFRRYYPRLAHVPVTHRWAGPIDRSYDSLPLMGRYDDHGRILYGVGWSGDGVGGSGFGSRILAGLALEERNTITECALVDRTVRRFPPEPFRYVGAHVVRSGIAARERALALGKRPGMIARALTNLAPTGVVHDTRS